MHRTLPRIQQQPHYPTPSTSFHLCDACHGYTQEVVRHLSTLTDDEDRQLLVNNVLEEIRGKELQVAGDPKCSRDIETLLAHGSAAHLISYLSACLESGDLSQLAVR
jgi:hypothetical protein